MQKFQKMYNILTFRLSGEINYFRQNVFLIKQIFLHKKLFKYKGWGKSHGNNFFFYDTSPVGKCDIYRRKDKVLTTCVDAMPADIPHDTYTFVIRSHISTK